jgi:hypothetical protein
MSGWQKIGVVASVLWLIGLPTYLVVHSSMNADHLYDECMKSFADLTREEQRETCWSSSHLGAVTPRIIGDTLIAGSSDTAALWTMMLGPVVLLWAVGTLTLNAVRWIRRRLSERGPSQ